MNDTEPETKPVMDEDGVELLPDRYGVLIEPRRLGPVRWYVGTLYLTNHGEPDPGPQVITRRRSRNANLYDTLAGDAAHVQERDAPTGFPWTVEPLRPRGLSALGRLVRWYRYQGWDISTCCTCGARPAVQEYRATMPGSDRWDWMQCAGCIPVTPWAEKYDSRPLQF